MNNPSVSPPESSTTLERKSLDSALNMTDGHARHELLPFENDIVASLPTLFESSLSGSQTEAERFFLDSFFKLACQSTCLNNTFLNFSASTSTLLIGKILRDLQYRVHAPYPAFDNLINLLKWLHINVEPYPDNIQSLLSLCETSSAGNTAIWVFIPNNPTGSILTQDQFQHLTRTAKRRNITLVFDFCFRFFSAEVTSYDQYKHLREEGAKFFAIEDTGKTWNTSDTKVSCVSCSDNYRDHLFEAHDHLLLNISPFQLAYLGQVLQQTLRHGLHQVIWNRFQEKRQILMSSVRHLPFVDHSSHAAAPLIWLKETQPGGAQRFVRKAYESGIHVLPGAQFFSNDPLLGQGFVRLPLARPNTMLAEVAATFQALRLV
jgi:aspartate/methionine/tyrosine aminotransferase